MHYSRFFWLSKFPLKNQLLFFWVFLYMCLALFSPKAFSTLLCYVFFVLAIICHWDFPVLSILCSVCFLYLYGCVGFKVEEIFFYDLVEDLIYANGLVLFSSIPISKRFVLFVLWCHISYVFLFVLNLSYSLLI